MHSEEKSLYYMKAALNLAKKGAGKTSPNPMVGALVVKDDTIIGYGWHMKAGGPHAEIFALDQAKENAKDATLYVTLEPCSHQGKTPPCTEAIINAGIKEVVIAMIDPNTLVSGNGIAQLKEAGIEVRLGIMEEEAKLLNDIYIKNITQKKTFCSLKTAITLDGKTATSSGSSRWVTGDSSREYVHILRSRHDAVLTGVRTVLADDCQLNVRLNDPCLPQPVRIILDPELDTPLDAKILDTETAPTMIITKTNALNRSKQIPLTRKGAKIYALPHQEDQIDLFDLWDFLYQMGIMSVMVEAGSTLNESFLKSGLVDKYYVFVAPKFIGGNEAPGIFNGPGIANMANAFPLQIIERMSFGEDTLFIAYPKKGGI
ncbi:MAG: bifunctional diaminohydroxyphosphoribosylaminopyrimidine deaminase/5-amino-6-(5-phosphoribosylamino)uracil reductase RibD [Bacillota bacterium]|jgi:diaminohydroxyphosphoribosylaminopyrimidine deaminase/5-amino-6-(5-phosphoribosylamino)uracil reductase